MIFVSGINDRYYDTIETFVEEKNLSRKLEQHTALIRWLTPFGCQFEERGFEYQLWFFFFFFRSRYWMGAKLPYYFSMPLSCSNFCMLQVHLLVSLRLLGFWVIYSHNLTCIVDSRILCWPIDPITITKYTRLGRYNGEKKTWDWIQFNSIQLFIFCNVYILNAMFTFELNWSHYSHLRNIWHFPWCKHSLLIVNA